MILEIFLETAFSTFEYMREIQIIYKQWRLKKGFLCFYSVCMFVYVCVCPSVITLEGTPLNVES